MKPLNIIKFSLIWRGKNTFNIGNYCPEIFIRLSNDILYQDYINKTEHFTLLLYIL